MALTSEFKRTFQDRVKKDPNFVASLYKEGIKALFEGEIELGKSILRDLINVTIGFPKLSTKTQINPKSLMRMFSSTGNPRTDKLFKVLHYLGKCTKTKLFFP